VPSVAKKVLVLDPECRSATPVRQNEVPGGEPSEDTESKDQTTAFSEWSMSL
jgi:hypothetical protein